MAKFIKLSKLYIGKENKQLEFQLGGINNFMNLEVLLS